MRIPRQVHQIWIQGADVLPQQYRSGVSSWKKHNTGWTHRLWDEESLRALMLERGPDWWPLYASQSDVEAKADVGRYALLETLGGVYADIDTECRRPLAPLFERSAARFQATCYWDHARKPIDCVTNSVIGSTPDHPIWRSVFHAVANNHGTMLTIFRTGPEMLRPIVRRYAAEHPDDVAVIGYPYAITTCFVPKVSMRMMSRTAPENCILDFNDSGRRAIRREIVRFPSRVVRGLGRFFGRR
jgi:mannosyltransferase OCH1-like enzyme